MISFDDILGQDRAIDSLRRAYRADRLPHGLIFAGPVGVGKATTARALGALFLCEKPKGDKPCGKCGSCVVFDANNHPDFHVITKELIRVHDKTGKSKGIDLSINVIRPELIDRAGLKPLMGVGKVFVIEQAELMNPQAQNAMLKTLEEPAGRTVIVLLTDQPHALLPTIRSRCQLVQFQALDEKAVREQLVARDVSAQNAQRAATISEGSLGAALRWIEDGVVEAAGELEKRLTAIESGAGSGDLADWYRKAADAYAAKQLERDELGSKDQATREGLSVYLRLASQFLRGRLSKDDDPDRLERVCTAIDAIARAETYLDSNVNIPLVLQQLAVSFERSFPPRAVSAMRE